MSPSNRVTGNSVDGIVVLRVQRDKSWNKVQIAERFEVPYVDLTTATRDQKLAYQAMVEGTAYAVGKHAIDRYEKLRHWKFDTSRAPFLDKSEAQYDLEHFRSSSTKHFDAVDQGSLLTERGMVAYVLKMWFIMPEIEVEVITPEPQDPEVTDGLVNPYKMPAYYSFEEQLDGK